MEEYRKEYLGSGITAFVSDDHTFGTDAVLLADFASPTAKSICCDLGSGCGIIPLLWCKDKAKEIYAVEIQEKGYKQILKAIEFNNLDSRLTAVHSDLNDLKGKIPFGYFNIVTMNPPYTAEGAGIISETNADKIARHGTMCTFDDICSVAAKLLNFGGKLCMCIRPERMFELSECMSKNGIEPKRIRFVSKTDGKTPWLVLIEGKRGAKKGLKVEPELHIYKDKDTYSDEMKEIYRDYLLENRGE